MLRIFPKSRGLRRLSNLALAGVVIGGCNEAGELVDPVASQQQQAVSSSAPAAAPAAVKDRYIVVFKRGVVAPGINGRSVADVASAVAQRHGGTVRRRFQHALSGVSMQMPASAVSALRADPRVEYVVEDGTTKLHDVVTWGKDRVDQRSLPLNQVYSAASHGEGVHVYVIDTGIRATHGEFQGGPSGGSRIGVGVDLFNDDTTPEDQNGHGTHTAGTIGGTNYGVANQVTIHPVKIFGAGNSTEDSMTVEAVEWVTARHLEAPNVPMVVNMSLGGDRNPAVNDAVANSIASGVTYVVSAGNNGLYPAPIFDACQASPASTPDAITVASSTVLDVRSDFSSSGHCVDLFAPGSRVLSSWFTSDTDTIRLDGTSMAAPHVTGAAALYLALNPSATPAQVASALIGKASRGRIADPRPGTPNRLLYVANLASGGDTQPPTVSLTSPSNGSTVSGTATITATASDTVGVTAVELFVNGAYEGQALTAPYQLSWDTIPYAAGTYSLTVKAYDDNGNVTTSNAVSVQLAPESNPPAVTITAPTSGGAIGAATTLRASVSDASGVQSVRFLVDDVEVGVATAPVSGSSYEVAWDGRSVTPGTHTLVVRALDRLNVERVTSPLTFTTYADATPPTVSITAPAAGASVSGAVTFSATVTDDHGVVSEVNFIAGGQVVCTDTAAPYSCTWNTRPEGDGTITLQVKAVDPFGNVGASATRNVSVTGAPKATFNAGLQAPACSAVGPSCTSARLVDGQGATEPNRPNTIAGSCPDGTNLGRYHFEESLDRLFITTLDNTNLAPGKHVRVEAKAYLLGDADYIDLYYAPNAAAPVWTYLTTLHQAGSVHDTISLSTEFDLQTGGPQQAIRASLRAFGSPSPCAAGDWNDRDDLVFAVAGGSQTPVVDAGPDRTITQVGAAALDGTVSGTTTSSAWTKTSGPGTVAFASASAIDTSATFSAIGSYVLTLTANNGALSSSDTMTTTVNPDAGPDRTVTLPASASLDGTAPAVGTVSYGWSKLSGPGTVTFANASAVDTTATFSATGTYTLKLAATNGSFSGADTTTVIVSAGGANPCASLCGPPTVFSSANYQSGNLGTGATCHETTASPSGLVCGEFAAGRTFRVNDQLVTCGGGNISLSTIPKRNGGYCFQASAGNQSWAYFATF